MSFASATQRFNAQASAHRALGRTVSISVNGAAAVNTAKSPSKVTRMLNEQGTGYVLRTISVFTFPASGAYAPAIGAQWTITAAPIPSDVGTAWRCFELTAASSMGNDHRCVCFRLD